MYCIFRWIIFLTRGECNDITVQYVFVLNALYAAVGSRPMQCFSKFFFVGLFRKVAL